VVSTNQKRDLYFTKNLIEWEMIDISNFEPVKIAWEQNTNLYVIAGYQKDQGALIYSSDGKKSWTSVKGSCMNPNTTIFFDVLITSKTMVAIGGQKVGDKFNYEFHVCVSYALNDDPTNWKMVELPFTHSRVETLKEAIVINDIVYFVEGYQFGYSRLCTSVNWGIYWTCEIIPTFSNIEGFNYLPKKNIYALYGDNNLEKGYFSYYTKM